MNKHIKRDIIRNFTRIALLCVTILFVNLVSAGYWTGENSKNKAVIIVPVADTATKPLDKKDTSVTYVYDNLPCSPGKDLIGCARVHQQLFNEVVTLGQERGEEVQCMLDNVFYEGPLKNRVSTFWTLKKNIKLLQELTNLESIPQPYAYNCQTLVEDQETQNIVI